MDDNHHQCPLDFLPHCNETYHGINGTQSKEWQHSKIAMNATDVYQCITGNLDPSDDFIQHGNKLSEILNWTKQHLDA